MSVFSNKMYLRPIENNPEILRVSFHLVKYFRKSISLKAIQTERKYVIGFQHYFQVIEVGNICN